MLSYTLVKLIVNCRSRPDGVVLWSTESEMKKAIASFNLPFSFHKEEVNSKSIP